MFWSSKLYKKAQVKSQSLDILYFLAVHFAHLLSNKNINIYTGELLWTKLPSIYFISYHSRWRGCSHICTHPSFPPPNAPYCPTLQALLSTLTNV